MEGKGGWLSLRQIYEAHLAHSTLRQRASTPFIRRILMVQPQVFITQNHESIKVGLSINCLGIKKYPAIAS